MIGGVSVALASTWMPVAATHTIAYPRSMSGQESGGARVRSLCAED
jgi:hypothetical protein